MVIVGQSTTWCSLFQSVGWNTKYKKPLSLCHMWMTGIQCIFPNRIQVVGVLPLYHAPNCLIITHPSPIWLAIAIYSWLQGFLVLAAFVFCEGVKQGEPVCPVKVDTQEPSRLENPWGSWGPRGPLGALMWVMKTETPWRTITEPQRTVETHREPIGNPRSLGLSGRVWHDLNRVLWPFCHPNSHVVVPCITLWVNTHHALDPYWTTSTNSNAL